jgi:asparagine synthase (glutamine-hydrolysing)
MERASSDPIALLAPVWDSALQESVRGASRWSLLYSGGLDSSLVALGLRDRVDLELVTVGVEGSSDLPAAEEGALVLGLPWRPSIVDADDVGRMLEAEKANLEGVRPVSRAVLVSTALALDAARRSHVVCGQGADELFLGYAHFEGLAPAEAGARRQLDLDLLLRDDWPRATRLAARRGRSIVSPFLVPRLIRQACEIPVEDLQAPGQRKPVLRTLAKYLGLPAELRLRPKKAFQYGSGIDRLVRSLIRANGSR